jgi:hypothetical protein
MFKGTPRSSTKDSSWESTSIEDFDSMIQSYQEMTDTTSNDEVAGGPDFEEET